MGNYLSDELAYWSIFPNDRANRKCNLRMFAINGQLVYFSVSKGLSFLAFLTIFSTCPLFLEFLSNLSILEVH